MDGLSLPKLLVAAHESEAEAAEPIDLNKSTLPPLNSAAILGGDLVQVVVNAGRNRKKKVVDDNSRQKGSHESKRANAEDCGDSDSDSDQTPRSAMTHSDSDSEATSNVTKSSAPVIPPRLQNNGFRLPEEDKHKAKWFRILSPRELKGIDGPYSEIELKLMYKKGDLTDSTMIWTEGQTDWEQLLFMKELRPRLVQIPLMPPKLGEDVKADTYNPITTLPSELDAISAKPLEYRVLFGNMVALWWNIVLSLRN